MQTLLEKHWHHLPDEEVLDLLDTDPEGKALSALEALSRADIGIMDCVHILVVGLVIYLVIGAEKTLRRRRETGSSER